MYLSREMRCAVLLHSFLFANSFAHAAGQGKGDAELTADEVLSAYESGCAALTSFDVVLDVTSETVLMPIGSKTQRTPLEAPKRTWGKADPPVVSRRRSRQRYRGGMFRIDVMRINERDFPDDSFAYAWDEEKYKTLSIADRSGAVQGYARTQFTPAIMSYQNLFLTFDGDYSLAEFIRDRRLSGEWRDSQFVLTAHPTTDSKVRASRFGLRLHLDPAHGFMPTEGAYLIEGEPWPQCEWKNELYEPVPGIWVPRAGAVTVIMREKDSAYAGKPVGISSLTIDAERSHFNKNIDAAVFSIDFPPGLRILDDVKKVGYISGPNGTETHLESLVEPGRRAMDSFDSEPKDKARRIGLIAINVVVVILTAIALWWKRR